MPRNTVRRITCPLVKSNARQKRSFEKAQPACMFQERRRGHILQSINLCKAPGQHSSEQQLDVSTTRGKFGTTTIRTITKKKKRQIYEIVQEGLSRLGGGSQHLNVNNWTSPFGLIWTLSNCCFCCWTGWSKFDSVLFTNGLMFFSVGHPD